MTLLGPTSSHLTTTTSSNSSSKCTLTMKMNYFTHKHCSNLIYLCSSMNIRQMTMTRTTMMMRRRSKMSYQMMSNKKILMTQTIRSVSVGSEQKSGSMRRCQPKERRSLKLITPQVASKMGTLFFSPVNTTFLMYLLVYFPRGSKLAIYLSSRLRGTQSQNEKERLRYCRYKNRYSKIPTSLQIFDSLV